MTTPAEARARADYLDSICKNGTASMLRSLSDQVEALTAELSNLKKATCNCRFDGDVNTEQCTLHAAWRDTLHEQADYRRERDNLINLLENSWEGWFPAVHDGAGFDRHEFVFKSSERDLRIAIKGTA
jgi:hypothetical protein